MVHHGARLHLGCLLLGKVSDNERTEGAPSSTSPSRGDRGSRTVPRPGSPDFVPGREWVLEIVPRSATGRKWSVRRESVGEDGAIESAVKAGEGSPGPGPSQSSVAAASTSVPNAHAMLSNIMEPKTYVE